MSKTIDEKVVSMQFDNKNFESNVNTSLSTIEKLKQALNFKGASKGLEGINAAAGKVNMSGMSNAIETVHAKFSALEVMGVTALANITNSAVNAGKNMVKALTIEPIMTGFQEYETKINAIQTIMSNTASKGTTMADVTKTLNELNTYADKTIYNFAEMTRNIGTFTAAGVGLKESASAIQGIANLAAASGSSSQQASTAMYQLSQAIATGTVKLMDWNSVVNAGMGGEKFQEALKATAREHGVAVDEIIKKNGSFRDSLQEGWLSAEILNDTLSKFTVDGAKKYAQSMMESGKWTKEQADALIKEAQSMEDAATKVKTFTQLWDTMKESVQSGWAQTWEILIGDFEEARELLSSISDWFGKIIGKSSDRRNKLLEGALSNNPFSKLAERIEKVTGATDKMTQAVKNYGEIADKVIGGSFGNGQERIEKLTKAGYDWAHVQNLVNEKLGDGTRHATDYKESQENLNKTQATTIEDLVKMTDAQLKHLGFTKDEISAFRELEEQSKRTGIPIKDLIKDMDQLNGRTLLINSFKNIGSGIVTVLESIGKAWRNAFPPMTSEQLYNIIAGFHKFSTYLVVGDDTANKLTRTFKGLFAIIDLISSILGGGFKLGMNILKEFFKVLGLVDVDILSITASVGDAIVAFRDWYEEHSLINKAIEFTVPLIVKLVKAIADFVKSIADLPQVQDAIEGIKKGFEDFSDVGDDILEGLKNGLEDGISSLPGLLIDLGKKLLEAIKGVLGIHSPSKEFFEIGQNVIEGLLNGLKAGLSNVFEGAKIVGRALIDGFNEIDFTKLFVMGSIVGFGLILNKIASAFEGVGDVFEGVGDVLESTSKWIDAKKLEVKSEALLNIAKAIGILAAAVILMSQIDQGRLWSAVGVLGVLTAGIVVLTKATEKLNPAEFGKLSILMLSLSGALLILSIAVKKLSGIDVGSMGTAMLGLAGMIAGMTALLYAYGKMVKGDAAANISKAGGMMIKMAIGLGLMAMVIKIASGMSLEDVGKGLLVVAGIEALFAAIIFVSKYSGQYGSGAGSMLLKMSLAIGIMVGVIRLIANISWGDIAKGLIVVAGIEALFAAIVFVSKFAGQHASKAGSMMLKMSVAIGIMAGAIKIIAGISTTDLTKGLLTVAGIEVLFAGFVALSKFVGKDTTKIGGMMLKMAAGMAVMGIAIKLLASIPTSDITKGLLVIAGIEILFAAIIAVSQLAGRNASSAGSMLLKMSTAILILSGAIALLSILDPEDVKRGTNAVSQLLLCFGAVVAASGLATNSIKTLTTLITGIGLIVGAVVLLTMIDQSKMKTAVQSLSMLMTVFSILIAASSLAKKAKGTVGTMLILTGVVGALSGILYMLSSLDVQTSIGTATALSELLLALSASMVIISKVKMVSVSAYIAIGVMTLVVGLLGGILYLLKDLPVDSTLTTAQSISTLLLSLSAACVILGAVGLLKSAAFIGIGALLTLIGSLGVLIVAIGALVDKFPSLETFLNKGIPVLEKIGYALGSFVSNIAAGLTDGLPTIGKNLSDFMTNLNGFITGANNISPEAMEGCKTLAQMLLILTGANILEKLTSWITGGSSLASFAQQLVPFGEAMAKFSETINGRVNAEAVTATANAGKVLAEVATALPKVGGVWQSLSGTNMSLTEFGAQLQSFGKAMAQYSSAVSGNIDEEAVTASANAGLSLAKVAEALPKVGGLMESLSGTKMTMGEFGGQLAGFGKAMVSYSAVVGADGAINEAAITASSNAGLTLAKLAEALPRVGGLMDLLSGKKMTMEEFGSQLKAFGKAMVGYSQAISADGAFNGDAVTASANAGLALAKLANALPKDGGLFSMFSGSKVTLEEFGADLKTFGGAIAEYAKKVAGINAESTSGSITVVKNLVKLIKSMDGLDTSGVSSFKNAMKILGTVDVSSIVKNFNGSASKLSSIGSTITKNIAKGIKPEEITNKIKSVINNAKNAGDKKPVNSLKLVRN